MTGARHEATGSVRRSRGWSPPPGRPARLDAGKAARASEALELRHRPIAKEPGPAGPTCKGKRLGRHARTGTPLRYDNRRDEARGHGQDDREGSA